MLGRFAIGIWARMTLRVTLEIVPLGDEANKRTIHTIDISNIAHLANFPEGALCCYRIKTDGVNQPAVVYHYREAGAIKLAADALERVVSWLKADKETEANT